MSNKTTKVMNIFISFGFLFFIAIFVTAFIYEDLLSKNAVLALSLLLQILFGVIVFNTSILYTHKAYQIFLGLLIGGWGILLYLMHFVLPFSVYNMWPVFLFFSGIFLIVSGAVKYKSFKFGFGIPAITLILMGIWFSLFSFKIIKIPFSVVATILGPIFMLAVAIFLIIFFFVQQRHSELIVNDEVHGDFADEEITHLDSGK